MAIKSKPTHGSAIIEGGVASHRLQLFFDEIEETIDMIQATAGSGSGGLLDGARRIIGGTFDGLLDGGRRLIGAAILLGGRRF